MSSDRELRLSPLSDLLHMASLVAENAMLHPEVAAALAEYGYTEARFRELRELRDRLREAYEAYRAERIAAMAATDRLRSLRREANRRYITLLTLARFAFREDEAVQQRLRLRGRRARAFSAWREEVESFYDALEEAPALRERLACYGVDAARLAAGRAALEEVVATRREQEEHRAEAVALQQRRWELQRALYRWLSEFRIIARMAVDEEYAQLLEGVGIKVPS